MPVSMIPEKVTTLHQLRTLALSKKSVVTPHGGMLDKPKPASVVINMTGLVILGLIDRGLYVYQPNKENGQ